MSWQCDMTVDEAEFSISAVGWLFFPPCGSIRPAPKTHDPSANYRRRRQTHKIPSNQQYLMWVWSSVHSACSKTNDIQHGLFYFKAHTCSEGPQRAGVCVCFLMYSIRRNGKVFFLLMGRCIKRKQGQIPSVSSQQVNPNLPETYDCHGDFRGGPLPKMCHPPDGHSAFTQEMMLLLLETTVHNIIRLINNSGLTYFRQQQNGLNWMHSNAKPVKPDGQKQKMNSAQH